MKKLAVRFFAVLAIAISTAVSTFGQYGFAYQAVIRDGDGKLQICQYNMIVGN